MPHHIKISETLLRQGTDRYTTDTYRHSDELQQYQCWWRIGCNGLIYFGIPEMILEVTRSACFW